jgi:amino acid transporter
MKFKSIQLLLLGTGIFVLSGQAAATSAGPSVIISFVIAGIVALLSALSMAEMASLMASCGSAYTYAYVGELIILSFFFQFSMYIYVLCLYFSVGRYVE